MKISSNYSRVSIVLTRYNEPDSYVIENLIALSLQQEVEGEIIFLDQGDGIGIKRFIERFNFSPFTIRYVQCPQNGLSFARNLGIEHANYDIIIFTDPDTIAGRGWAKNLTHSLLSSRDKGVAIAGGKIRLSWPFQPFWLAKSKPVADIYGYFDLGDGSRKVASVRGMSLAINKPLIPKLEDGSIFDVNYGRIDGKLVSGEESELCKRVISAGMHVVYEGQSVVDHKVQPDRLSLAWVWKRLYHGGWGRARLGGRPKLGESPKLYQYLFLPIILPPYALGFLVGKLSEIKARKKERR